MNNLIQYTLHLADNALILAQRNSEWCAHGPILEQDIAITNITLDLIGQSRNFYQYAAQLINENTLASSPRPNGSSLSGPEQAYGQALERAGGEATEDSLAYLRTEKEFKNCLLVELPNGDWGQTTLRLFFISVYQYLLYEQLKENKDAQLSAIAAKAIKEVTYHVKWSGEWVIRLGDGTGVSHQRMIKAIDYLWMYTGELFQPAYFEQDAGINILLLKDQWMQKIKEIFEEATLKMPGEVFMQSGGKEGNHTEHMGFILTELQYLQRTYPGAEW